MTALITLCPSCSSPLDHGQTRCDHCEQVLGEDNRCEHCSALAPAVEQGGTFSCYACGASRTRRARTVVVGPRYLEHTLRRGRLARVAALTGAWLVALAGLFVAAMLVIFGQNMTERGAGALIATIALGIASFFARLSRLARLRVAARVRASLEQRLMGLAAQRKGGFTADDAARHLGIGLTEANGMLDALVRTQQADMQVSERGEIRFVLVPSRHPEGVRLSEAPQLGRAARRQPQAASH